MRVYMKRNEQNILNRRPFKEATISGYSWNNIYYVDSYRTTIAFYDAFTDTWFLTTERFSVITSTQQHALRMILSTEHVLTFSPETFAAQLKVVSSK